MSKYYPKFVKLVLILPISAFSISTIISGSATYIDPPTKSGLECRRYNIVWTVTVYRHKGNLRNSHTLAIGKYYLVTPAILEAFP